MTTPAPAPTVYGDIHTGIVELLDAARQAAARSVNALMTASYWEIGRRIVEFEQGGTERAEYGEGLLKRLSADLTTRFGRGFPERNLEQMRLFYLGWPISQTVSGESIRGIQPCCGCGRSARAGTRPWAIGWKSTGTRSGAPTWIPGPRIRSGAGSARDDNSGFASGTIVP